MPDQPTVSALHEAARQHAREGRRVFPCWPGTKIPATPNGFRDATSDLAVIDAWWIENPDYNLAYCPGDHGECVVDIDGAPGEAAWEVLMLCEHCPDTREARTPRGGRHLTFTGQLPPTAWRTNSKRCLGECIDTRGAGSYVVLPPSRTEDGEYRWLNDLAPAPVPDWMVEKTKRRDTRTSAPDGLELDLPGNVQRARSRAKHASAPAEGSRNTEAFQIACELRDLGVTPPVAFEILAKEWNPRCEPPLELGELAQTVESAGRNAQNAPGAYATRSASETFGATVENIASDTIPSREARGVRIYTERQQNALPDVRWRIKGILPDSGQTVLSSKPKSGKSLVAIDLALSIASNRPAFKCPQLAIELPGPVVYLTNEGFRTVARRRRPAWRIAREIPGDEEIPFYLADDVPLAAEPDAADAYSKAIEAILHAEARGRSRLALIVIDTLSKSLGGLDENSPASANLYYAMAALLERRFGCGTLTVAHTRKDGEESVRGSSAFRGNFDNLLQIDSDKATRTMRLWADAMKDEDDNWVYHLASEHIGLPGLDSGSYVLQWITPDAYRLQTAGNVQLYNAAVAAAIWAAEHGQPITRQRYPVGQQDMVLDQIEGMTDRIRLNWKQVLDYLERGRAAGELVYVPGGSSKKGFAGYRKPPQLGEHLIAGEPETEDEDGKLPTPSVAGDFEGSEAADL